MNAIVKQSFVVVAGSCGINPFMSDGHACYHLYDGECRLPQVLEDSYNGRPKSCPFGQGPLKVTVEQAEEGK